MVPTTMEDGAPADVEKWAAQYIGLRDALKVLRERHDKEQSKYSDLMASLAGLLQKFLDDHNLTSVRTKGGTASVSTRYTASLADPKIFFDYVLSSKKYDLLDKRANATAVKDYVNEHNQLPPGANLTALKTVGVRRPTEK